MAVDSYWGERRGGRIDRVGDLLRQAAGRQIFQFAVGEDARMLCDS